jgi:hypothetical protein
MSVHAVSLFVGELVKPVAAAVAARRPMPSLVPAVRSCTHGLGLRQVCESCDLDDWLFERGERF